MAQGTDRSCELVRLDSETHATSKAPLISHEYALRVVVDFFAIRRLYTATGPCADGKMRSLRSLFDWINSCFAASKGEKCAVLEIPFFLPDNFVRQHFNDKWDVFSHATDIRELTSVLNTGCLCHRAWEKVE